MATAAARWPWVRQPTRHKESADDVAARLSQVADELEEATTELRSLVTGLRAVSPTVLLRVEREQP